MKRQFTSLFHIGYWSFYITILLIVFFAVKVEHAIPDRLFYFLGVALLFVILPSVLGFYTSYLLLFTKYVQDRKIPTLIGFCTAGILFISALSAASISLIFGKDFMFKNGFHSFSSELLIISIIALVNGVVGFILKGFFSWYSELKMKEELVQQNHSVQLELIKSKLDPHFLFNTINNIDGLMIRDADIASNYLDKLSTILRFMLYETDGEEIPLSKEIEYIQKYIDLQKIRTSVPEFVEFKVEGMANTLQIPPMLFIPFIENAFKHVSTNKKKHAIRIELNINEDKIDFKCQNHFSIKTLQSNEIGKMGNRLIQKRLQILYPYRHQLMTTVKDNNYHVHLVILTHEN